MATFLTTPKMSPALAARVEASVRGRPVSPGKALSPRAVAVLRLAALGAMAALIVWLVLGWLRGRDQLETERARLIAQVRGASSQLTASDRTTVARIEKWLIQHGAEYEGDEWADEIRDVERFAAAIAKPMVYLRGPVESFTRPTAIADSASTSFRDAFVLCLVDPPAARSEKAMLSRARAAFAGGKHTAAVAHVELFRDGLVGLPFLLPPWEARVDRAENRRDIAILRGALERAPLNAATRVAKVRHVLVVMDERKDGKGPTELDGACAHHIRVELMNLETEKVLLRLRKHVDPEWISEGVRSQYANGINSCELAFEVHEERRSRSER